MGVSQNNNVINMTERTLNAGTLPTLRLYSKVQFVRIRKKKKKKRRASLISKLPDIDVLGWQSTQPTISRYPYWMI